MKTIKLLSILCEAISSVTEVNCILNDKYVDTRETAALEPSERLLQSNTMGVVRDLTNELPEKLITDELRESVNNFYAHKFMVNREEGDRNMQLYALTMASNDLHKLIYDIKFAADEALELYA